MYQLFKKIVKSKTGSTLQLLKVTHLKKTVKTMYSLLVFFSAQVSSLKKFSRPIRGQQIPTWDFFQAREWSKIEKSDWSEFEK